MSKLPGAFLNPYLNNPLIGRSFELIAPGTPEFITAESGIILAAEDGKYLETQG